MHGRHRSDGAGRGRPGWAALVILLGGLPACTNQAVTLDPVDRARLEQRAGELLVRAVRSDVDILCCNAIEALVHTSPSESIPEFRAALNHESPLVRFAAAVALGETRDTGALEQLSRLRVDSDPRVRLAAAFALARAGRSGAVHDLMSALRDSPDAMLRADAAYLIGRLGEPRAIPWLERALKHETADRVRVHIFAAMAALGDRTAVESVISYSFVDTEARVLALQSLVELRTPDARGYLLDRLRDEFLETRLIAARGLGAIGSSEGFELAMENLDATFNDPEDPNRTFRVRSLAALALGAIGDERALPALQKLAETESDARTQVAASYAILQITSRTRQFAER